ncbi:hypothetical protein KIW84_031824 [Lathyrus oleraceus]|uniref:Uncharacterized protein n=1 Tax=Pisum sativum TaxID=3888 RepID=A0A9D5AXY1_PEA|nr:hypothetical protein KIW84_031824 [Pisum sativum]
MDTTQLLYLIMSGKWIDVAQIIANEMRCVTESGKEFGTGTRSTCPLVFPDLIMGLLIASRSGGQPNVGHHFMTPEEFQIHIVWLEDKPFYRGEAAAGHGNGNEDDEEDAEEEDEEGTSEGSKIASDDDEEMGGE